ncbi:MAG: hypothetical protein ACKO85_07090 [Isosphaeraceae bacterium]
MINASILPLLTAALAAATSCFFSFASQPLLFKLLTAVSLALIVATPLVKSLIRKPKAETTEPAASESRIYQGLSSVASLTLSLLSCALLALVLVTPVRWPAAVAFGLAMVNVSLKNPSASPLKDLLTALVAMFCVWPLAPELTQRVETRSQIYLSQLVSDRLDSREILNFPSGTTIEMEKGNVPITRSGGHLSGLRSWVLAACATAMLMNRGPVHTSLLALSGYFWALFSNALWFFGRSVALSGTAGLLDGLWASVAAVCLATLILILSSDQLLLVLGLLNPLMWIRRDRKNMEGENASPDAGPTLEAPAEKPPVSIPVAAFWLVSACCLGIAAFDSFKVMGKSSARLAVSTKWQKYQVPGKASSWPERIGRWSQLKEPLIGAAAPVAFAPETKIISDTYAFNNKIVRVSWLGPVWSWQDRFQDYMHQGWKVGNARIVSETANNKPYMVVDLSQPTGERAKLVYLIQTTDGKTTLEPNIRSIPRTAGFHFLQSLFLRGSGSTPDYITELFLQSYAILKDDDLQSLDEIATGVFTRALPDELK